MFRAKVRRKRAPLNAQQTAFYIPTGTDSGPIYERVTTPSIDDAKKLAKILGATVGYLLGENDEATCFKDPKMLQRFQDISVLPEKECLLTTVDHFIKSAKTNAM